MNHFQNKYYDYILLGFFIICAVLLFGFKINIPEITQREQTLLSGFQFFFALVIGFLLQRIYSREVFRNNLREYAFSAYRRISDINKSVIRIKSEIKRMRKFYPINKVHELDILRNFADEMSDTVTSSMYDWADIIGEEIEKVEKIKELQIEKAEVIKEIPGEIDTETTEVLVLSDEQTRMKLKELEDEIGNLKTGLPLIIGDTYDFTHSEDMLPRDGRISPIIQRIFRDSIERDSCIHLLVKIGSDLDDQLIDYIKKGAPYYLSTDSAMGHTYLTLYRNDGDPIGEIRTLYENESIYHRDYIETLFEFIGKEFNDMMPDGMYGMLLTGSQFDKLALDDRQYYINVLPLSR